MKNEVIVIVAISFVLLIIMTVVVVKRFKTLSSEQRQKEIDESLDRASWATVIKNMIQGFFQ